MSLPAGGYPQYVPLTPAERRRGAAKIVSLLEEYSERTKIFSVTDIQCRKETLFEIVERVEKRRIYFHVFHGLTMSEQNETCLYCFWITKLAPFFNVKNPDHQINAYFAAYLFLRTLRRVSQKKGYALTVDRKHATNLVYAFNYRDLSKEAIMAMADALVLGASACA